MQQYQLDFKSLVCIATLGLKLGVRLGSILHNLHHFITLKVPVGPQIIKRRDGPKPIKRAKQLQIQRGLVSPSPLEEHLYFSRLDNRLDK